MSTTVYSNGTLPAVNIFSTASMISGPIPSPFAIAIFIFLIFFISLGRLLQPNRQN